MSKPKARDKRKKAAVKKANVARSNSTEWQPSFKGYMRISLKKETDKATILANVIHRGDWIRKTYDIFKHERRFLIKIKLIKFDRTIKPAEFEVLTPLMSRLHIYDVAESLIAELSTKEDGTEDTEIDYGVSYVDIAC